MRANEIECRRTAVFERPQIVYGPLRRARRNWFGFEPPAALGRSSHHAIGVPVVGPLKHGDLVAPRDRARQAQRRHHRLRTRIGERHAVHARQLADQCGGFPHLRRPRSQLRYVVGLGAQRRLDALRVMTEERHTLAHRNVYVFVAIDVPDAGTARATADDGVEHLFRSKTKTHGGTAVGQDRPVVCRMSLGFLRARRVAGDERFQMLLLARCQTAGARL